MTKTEAANLIALKAQVLARQYGWTGRMTADRIAATIGEMRHQDEPGSLNHQAGWIRPADQTIRRAGRRMQQGGRK